MLRLKNALTKAEKEENTGKLLELWLEVGPYCHMHCEYCFNGAGVPVDEAGLLKMAEYKRVIREFKDLGGKVIGIPGNGEPLHPKNYEQTMAIIKYSHEIGIRTILFTAGDLINLEKAKKLLSLDVSLMIKFNSSRHSVQDKLVGSPGYSKRRRNAIKILKTLGFMDPAKDKDDNPITRIGFVTPILTENYEELPRLFKYCLKNNIMPDIDTVLPLGRGASISTEEAEKIKCMFAKLQAISKKEFKDEWIVSPTYVGGCCDRHEYHLYMDCRGNISPCLGANKKNIVLAKIDLSKAWGSPLMSCKVRPRNYSGKCTTCKSFEDKSCNSCLGRYMDAISETDVHTIGCWNYSEE